MKIQWKITLGVFVLLVAAFAQYWLVRGKNPQKPLVETGSTPASTTTPEVAISDPSGGGYEVKPLPLPKATHSPILTAPNLDALIAGIVPQNDYEKSVFLTLTRARDALKKDQESYNDWLTAGISLKQLEKYEAARDVFAYNAMLWPQAPVLYGNLGSLYHLYLKDFPKSEAAYQKAITLDPSQSAWHRGLYELYRYSYKINTNAWEETLKRGIAQSGSLDLMSVLAGRYADLKRFTESVALYDSAISEAEKQNNPSLVDRLIGLRAAARAEMK